MKYFFIINPKAGLRHNDIKALISNYAGAMKIKYSIAFTEYAGHAEKLARHAASLGYDNIIAAGGDGTAQESAKGVLGTRSALGLIPCGSGNGLARNLALPLDIKKAISGLFTWSASFVDIGFANDKLFLVSCGLGLDAQVAHAFNSLSQRRGIFPYVWHALGAYFTYKPEPILADIDGKKSQLCGLIISALIGKQYGGGAKIAPNAIINDGKLDLCIVNSLGAFKLLTKLPSLFNGTLDKHPEIYQSITFKTAKFSKKAPLLFHLDGEDFISECGTLKVRAAKRALKLLMPPAFL